MKAYVVRYRNRFGEVREYGLAASCVQHCKQWVSTLDGCTYLSARLI
jgi:hypothetical protein